MVLVATTYVRLSHKQKPMLIVELFGGLGNQMFQYALGRRLSIDRRMPLKLDISSFETYTLRRYLLSHFSIQAELATPAELLHFRSRRFDQRIKRRLEKWARPYDKRLIVTEQSPGFDARILQIGNDVYLNGYWQNEQYFAPVQAQIREEFTVKAPPSSANLDLLRQIESAQSVSLHIRRGDYASNPVTNQYHGLLPLSYYQEAVARITEELDKPQFFVFSDDIEWARAHLRLDFPTFIVDINGPDQAHEDLRLLCACQSHIIANSSFSWWGAWLSNRPRKRVYAPAQWFSNPVMNRQYTLPSSWERIHFEANQ